MSDSSGSIEVVDSGDDAVILVVAGELDIATAPELREKLIEQFSEGGRSSVVVDLTSVSFMDSTSLGVLVGAAKRAAAAEGWLRLVAPAGTKGRIRRTLAITGLDQVMPVYETVDAALQGRPSD